jgi:hypothetical protein
VYPIAIYRLTRCSLKRDKIKYRGVRLKRAGLFQA